MVQFNVAPKEDSENTIEQALNITQENKTE